MSHAADDRQVPRTGQPAPWRPGSLHPRPRSTHRAAHAAAEHLFVALGMDLTDPDLAETPRPDGAGARWR